MTPKQFKQLTKAEQRVAVAKDVLAQIKQERYVAKTSVYVELSRSNEDLEEKPVKENIHKIKKCKVCAIGSTILSIAKFKNTIDFDDVTNGGFSQRADSLLGTVFGKKQLALMEACFESLGSHPYARNTYNYTLPLEDRTKCINFYQDYRSQTDRLQAIMRNIIKNEGVFKP